jgi:hypothetical protein
MEATEAMGATAHTVRGGRGKTRTLAL